MENESPLCQDSSERELAVCRFHFFPGAGLFCTFTSHNCLLALLISSTKVSFIIRCIIYLHDFVCDAPPQGAFHASAPPTSRPSSLKEKAEDALNEAG